MILGLGNDIIEIDRIHDAIKEHGDRFIQRLFTQKEQDYCKQYQDPIPHYAVRFAAKEAIAKAFGSGFGEKAACLDIEIVNNPQGKPEVFFSSAFKKHFNNPEVLLSMSHCRDYASAVAIRIK